MTLTTKKEYATGALMMDIERELDITNWMLYGFFFLLVISF